MHKGTSYYSSYGQGFSFSRNEVGADGVSVAGTNVTSASAHSSDHDLEEQLFEIGWRCHVITRRMNREPISEFAGRLIVNLLDHIADLKATVREVEKILEDFHNRNGGDHA